MEPSVGTPLGIRFFDGTSLETSGFYNTSVNSDGSGDWISPTEAGATINFRLSKGTSMSEDSLGTFQTRIAVPEPSSAILLLGGLSLIWTRRMRR